MASNKNRKRKEQDSRLDEALKFFNASRDYQKDNWWGKWERDNKLYDQERHAKSYEGLADTFVPMVGPMIETMTGALANGTLRFDFVSGNPLKDPDTRAINGLVDEWWEQHGWDLNVEEGIREMGITGMSAHMLSWEIDHPEWESYAMRDIILDPTVKNPAQLQQKGVRTGRRYFIRKGALDDYEKVDLDPKSKTYGKLIKRYNIPDDTGYTPSGDDDDTDKMIKEIFSSSTLRNASKDQDEIIELWDIDRVVTIMNRSHVIEDVVNPYKQRHEDLLTQRYTEEMVESLRAQGIDYQSTLLIAEKEAIATAQAEATGLVPFFFFRNYRRTSLFYAKSEIDWIAKHQELLNDLTNIETDILIKTAKPQRELDPEYEDWIDLIDTDPETVYPFRPGSLQNIQGPNIGSGLFANRQNIKNEIREATAIDQVRKGVQNQREATATEVRAQMGSSGERIESKARTLEKDGFFWFAKILYRMIMLYVTEPQVVKVSGLSKRGKETGAYQGRQLPAGTAVFDPADYDEDFTPSISLEIDTKAKKQESQAEALQQFQLLIQDPTNNLAKVKEIFYPKILDIDKAELDDIITPDPTQQMAMDGGMPGAAPMPQEVANV